MVDDDGPEVLDLGAVDEPAVPDAVGAAPGSPLSRRAVLGLAGLTVAGGALVALRGRGDSQQALATQPTLPVPSERPPAPALGPGQIVGVDAGGPLLGGSPADVYAFAVGTVVRIALPTGRVTTTGLPQLSDGSVSFVPVRAGVLVHRADFGSTYLVPDGRPAQEASPALSGLGPLLPGPDLDHVWRLDTTDQATRLTLVGVDGRSTGVSVDMPAYTSYPPIADGGGYPLVVSVGGAYWARPGGLLRVTTGAVVASGRPGWLVIDCDDRDQCSGMLVDRVGGRRAAPGVVQPVSPGGSLTVPSGVLSPDGRRAALYVGDRGRSLQLVLLDLVTGERLPTELTLIEGEVSKTVAWTPDSRWLLGIDDDARIVVVTPESGRTELLVPAAIGAALPAIQQIAVRPRG